MPEVVEGQRSWYTRWWGKTLVGFGVFLFLIFLCFAIIVAKYWWQISHGQKPNIGTPPANSFTVSLSGSTSGRTDRSKLETSDDPRLGRSGAGIVIVEFVDFKCPNCLLAAPIMEKVLAKYGDKVQLIVRDFPVESTHPGASELSELADCADQQHRYWPMNQVLFDEQNTLSEVLDDASLARLAIATGSDVNALKSCLAGSAAKQEVRADYLAGVSAGVRGTPTFFINGEKVEGVIPFEAWEKYLEKVK